MKWLWKFLFLNINFTKMNKGYKLFHSPFYGRSPFLGLWDPQWLCSWCDTSSLGAQASHSFFPCFYFSVRCHMEPEPKLQHPKGWEWPNHFHFPLSTNNNKKRWTHVKSAVTLSSGLPLGFYVLSKLKKLQE